VDAHTAGVLRSRAGTEILIPAGDGRSWRLELGQGGFMLRDKRKKLALSGTEIIIRQACFRAGDNGCRSS
jgi:hypothetical protein